MPGEIRLLTLHRDCMRDRRVAKIKLDASSATVVIGCTSGLGAAVGRMCDPYSAALSRVTLVLSHRETVLLATERPEEPILISSHLRI
jgi:hypothetical protein